jgi:hypothetical protein
MMRAQTKAVAGVTCASWYKCKIIPNSSKEPTKKSVCRLKCLLGVRKIMPL